MSAAEHSMTSGYKEKAKATVKSIGFNYCALTFIPWKIPVAAIAKSNNHPYVFEFTAIVPWIRNYGKHPVTNDPLELGELIRLKYSKNSDGDYACPVSGKVFTNNSRIGFIKKTGNVFSMETIEELNVGMKNWRDLLDDTPFTRSDILILQDPTDPEWLKRNDISLFSHVTANEGSLEAAAALANKLSSEQGAAATHANPGGGFIRTTSLTKHVFAESKSGSEQLVSKTQALGLSLPGSSTPEGSARGGGHVAEFGVRTSAAYTGSFTSTGMSVSTRNVAATRTQADLDEDRWRRIRARKEKAYVRLHTSKGSLNLELFADKTPRTVENFLLLAERGYYDGVQFHRVIRNFMVQAGDPTGTGRGGESAWGGKFADEFHPSLSHSERGLLSMANAGPNTNGSQFFITCKSCTHLDKKHSIFGKLVGGMNTLREIETTPVNKEDRPLDPVTIVKIDILQDPCKSVRREIEEEEEKKAKAGAASENRTTSNSRAAKTSAPLPTSAASGPDGARKRPLEASAGKKSLLNLLSNLPGASAVPGSLLEDTPVPETVDQAAPTKKARPQIGKYLAIPKQ